MPGQVMWFNCLPVAEIPGDNYFKRSYATSCKNKILRICTIEEEVLNTRYTQVLVIVSAYKIIVLPVLY